MAGFIIPAAMAFGKKMIDETIGKYKKIRIENYTD
jgi:hypothetical protein